MKKQRNVVTVGKKLGKLEWQARFVVGKLRRGSSLTRNDQLNCLGRIGRFMQHAGLQSIKHIGSSEVSMFFKMLHKRGMSAGRMANHATAMRMLCRMIGKADIVPSNRVLGCSRDVANRTKYADIRVDAEKAADVRSHLSDNHKVAYDLARYLGLRQKEALLSHKIVNRNGVDYLVVEGAKGGRPRQVPITNDKQREVLQRNTDYRAAHGGKLIDRDKSLKQGMKALQNELAAAGASRESRANMHANRREYIIEQCQEIVKAPEHMRQQMVDELVGRIGHGRQEVIRCYTLILTITVTITV